MTGFSKLPEKPLGSPGSITLITTHFAAYRNLKKQKDNFKFQVATFDLHFLHIEQVTTESKTLEK